MNLKRKIGVFKGSSKESDFLSHFVQFSYLRKL